MQRQVARVGVWVAVTAAAIALSWFAVRSVLRDTVFEAPRAPALGAKAVEGRAPGLNATPATISATSFASTAPTTRPPSTTPAASPATRSAAPTTTAPTTPPAPTTRPVSSPTSGATRSFEVSGGRASFTFGTDSASLIAAVPNDGWAVKVWPGDRWIRVDFTRGERTSSIFVTWNDHPPLAETYEQ